MQAESTELRENRPSLEPKRCYVSDYMCGRRCARNTHLGGFAAFSGLEIEFVCISAYCFIFNRPL